MLLKSLHRCWIIWAGISLSLQGGPYSAALNDALNSYDAPVPGFVGPHGVGAARLMSGFDEFSDPIYQNPSNYVNPVFFDWASSVTHYYRSDGGSSFSNSSLALGEVTGDHFDTVSLGDLTATQITAGVLPGSITLQLSKPIQNFSGADFVVYENGVISQSNQGGAGIGGIFAELAYVEVSADGVNFLRFPSTSLTTSAVGGYGTINPTNVNNLAGKHANSYEKSWGTPFDLAQLELSQITHIRIVDIPGNGAFKDQAGRSIFDSWRTIGSGGFDLEALGSISTRMTYADWPQLARLDPADRDAEDDPDGDGLTNLIEYAFARLPWTADAGGALPTCRLVTAVGGIYPEVKFLRDERLIDLTYEVQVSASILANDWSTIAISSAGAAVVPVFGNLSVISESSAGTIQSVGVVREVRLRSAVSIATQAKQFFRVKVYQSL